MRQETKMSRYKAAHSIEYVIYINRCNTGKFYCSMFCVRLIKYYVILGQNFFHCFIRVPLNYIYYCIMIL